MRFGHNILSYSSGPLFYGHMSPARTASAIFFMSYRRGFGKKNHNSAVLINPQRRSSWASSRGGSYPPLLVNYQTQPQNKGLQVCRGIGTAGRENRRSKAPPLSKYQWVTKKLASPCLQSLWQRKITQNCEFWSKCGGLLPGAGPEGSEWREAQVC